MHDVKQLCYHQAEARNEEQQIIQVYLEGLHDCWPTIHQLRMMLLLFLLHLIVPRFQGILLFIPMAKDCTNLNHLSQRVDPLSFPLIPSG